MRLDDSEIWTKRFRCCCPQPSRPAQRAVHINRIVSRFGRSEELEKYPVNRVVTFRYTWWNFLPKNLFEQLLRVANSYFLCVAIIQMCNTDSPTYTGTSLIPLCSILALTAVKQGYEDYLRHKEDRKINETLIETVQDGRIETKRSEELLVGDVVRIRNNQLFPCDMLLLSSVFPTGECYVTTAGLDGETSFKTFRSPNETKALVSASSLSALRGVIECEQPTANLYKFTGRIVLEKQTMNSVNTGASTVLQTQHSWTRSEGVVNPAFDSADLTATSTADAIYDEPAENTSTQFNCKDTVFASLDEKNLLLRGARLRNTDFVFGCVVYTGPETKMAINTRGKRIKISCVEKRVNIFLVLQFLLLLLVTTISSVLVFYYRSVAFPGAWYLQMTIPPNNAGWNVIETLDCFTLYTYLIPISLYMTIEAQKFFGSLFFGWDEEMYDPVRQERAKANTSDLNEELGQIQYLFSDKTGTLTENEMVFRECFVDGVRYVDRDGRLFVRKAITTPTSVDEASVLESETVLPVKQAEGALLDFLTALTLCHTCRVEETTQDETNLGKRSFERDDSAIASLNEEATDVSKGSGANYEYQASSPDEKALLIAARQYGVVYHGAIDDTIMLTKCKTVQVEENETARSDWSVERYRLRHVLEFDAVRKCMSVIVETERGEYWLITKGAEVSMSERARRPNGSGSGSGSGSESKQEEIMEEVREYASRGLRTLVIGRRRLGRDEFERIDKRIREAQLVIENRAEALAAAYGETEQGLELLGATGVEDRLQEGVEETIEKLRQAGIVVWVLTGDKEESAVDVAYACGLFDEETRLVRVTQQADAETCLQTLQMLDSQTGGEESSRSSRSNASLSPDGLIIDGFTLAIILNEKSSEHELMKKLLLKQCLRCSSVIGCRVTPLQKAELVRLIKHGVDGTVTCAIGDGGNDVSMIREAHVGLGIFGKEGRQAAQTSDYCFARFRYLDRILLLHGHFFYNRIATFIIYFFYKNLVSNMVVFFYQFLCGFSQVSLVDPLSSAAINITYTSIPVIFYGFFEQYIDRELLLRKPELYKRIRRNATLSIPNFLRWQGTAVYQAAVIVFGSYIYFQYTTECTLPDGQPLDAYTYGSLMLMCNVIVVNIRLMIETRFWTAFQFGGFAFTILLGFYGLLIVFEAIWKPITDNFYYFVFLKALSYPVHWLLFFVIVVVCLLPDLIIKTVEDTFGTEGRLNLANQVIGRSRSQSPSSSNDLLNGEKFTAQLESARV